MKKTLFVRMLMALGLMAGFYVLALSIAGGLLYIPYAEVVYTHRIHPKIALLSLVGAGMILWAIFPRIDRFSAPGPELKDADHPKLFRVIAETARATGQALPEQVFLVADLNAWVAERGGFMGIGSRRIMGIGLPLLQVLSVNEFSSVIAHEFGHYHGGDTKLGPWIYKTRASIGRTVETLAGSDSILVFPFMWYGKAFLRVTHAVSRSQEYTADAIAAGVAGTAPMISGLKKVCSMAPAFDLYWRQEMAPVLDHRFRTPFVDGFSSFLRHPRIEKAIAEDLKEELNERKHDPYDTHPSLAERIAALLGRGESPAAKGDEGPAIGLIEDVAALEGKLFAALNVPNGDRLQAIAWEEVPAKVLLPLWKSYVEKHVAAFRGVTPSEFPHLAAAPEGLAAKFPGELLPKGIDREERCRRLAFLLGAAFTLALHGAGWKVRSDVGDDVVCEREGKELRPFAVTNSLWFGEFKAEEWRKTAAEAGIEKLDLGGWTGA